MPEASIAKSEALRNAVSEMSVEQLRAGFVALLNEARCLRKAMRFYAGYPSDMAEPGTRYIAENALRGCVVLSRFDDV